MKQFLVNVAFFFRSLKLLFVCEMVYTFAWIIMFHPEDFEELYYLITRMDILYPWLFKHLEELFPEYSVPKWVGSSVKYIDRRQVSVELLAKKRGIFSEERLHSALRRATNKSFETINKLKDRMDDYINQQ